MEFDASVNIGIGTLKPTHALQFVDTTKNKTIVTISHDGKVWVNPDYTIDDAAKAFWDAVIKLSKGEKS